MAGAQTTARPYMAKAWPRFSGGKVSARMACSEGARPPPPTPCRMRKKMSMRQRGREAAEGGADAEERDADHVELLAPDEGGHVGAGGEDDGVGDEVGGEDPGGFVLRGAEAAGDVGQGDVGDGGVEHLHEGGEGDGHGDDPGVDAGAPWAFYDLGRRRWVSLPVGGWRSPSAYLDSMGSCGDSRILRDR